MNATKEIQKVILYSCARKSNIRECFKLMRDKKFEEADEKILETRELLDSIEKVEKDWFL